MSEQQKVDGRLNNESKVIAVMIAGGELMSEALDDPRYAHDPTRANVEEMKALLRKTKRDGEEYWEAGFRAVLHAVWDLNELAAAEEAGGPVQ